MWALQTACQVWRLFLPHVCLLFCGMEDALVGVCKEAEWFPDPVRWQRVQDAPAYMSRSDASPCLVVPCPAPPRSHIITRLSSSISLYCRKGIKSEGSSYIAGS
jgi:hypothetical protein